MAVPHPHDVTVSFAVDLLDTVLHVTVSGELDLACAEVFDGLFDLDTTGVDTVVLDLSALTFSDVAGVNALAGLSAYHRWQGRTVHVVGALPHVLRLIALTQGSDSGWRRGAAPA